MTKDLEKLKRLIEKEDRSEILRRFPELSEEFSQRRRREGVLMKATNGIKSDVKLDEEVPVSVRNFRSAVSEVRSVRTRLRLSVSLFVGGGIDMDDALSVVKSAIDAEERFLDASEDVLSDIENADFPAILSISGPETVEVIKGTKKTAVYTIENVGRRKTENLKIEIDSDIDISLSAGIGELERMSSADVEIGVGGNESTESEVTLSALSQEGFDRIRIRIQVKNKIDLLERATQQAETIRRLTQRNVDDSSRGRGSSGNGRGGRRSEGIRNKIDNILDRIEEIRDDAKEGRNERSLNNRIDSIINSVEAFKNQVTSQREKKLDEVVATRVLLRSEKLIETLRKARDAEI